MVLKGVMKVARKRYLNCLLEQYIPDNTLRTYLCAQSLTWTTPKDVEIMEKKLNAACFILPPDWRVLVDACCITAIKNLANVLFSTVPSRKQPTEVIDDLLNSIYTEHAYSVVFSDVPQLKPSDLELIYLDHGFELEPEFVGSFNFLLLKIKECLEIKVTSPGLEMP
jgi:hypothetical protein